MRPDRPLRRPASARAVRAVAATIGVSRTEAAGLLVLLASAVGATGVLWFLATPRAAPGTPPSPASAPLPTPARTAPGAPAGDVIVHVAGAVLRPGVVEVDAEARVADALAAAGGAAADADVDRLNLARPLTDGEHLVVPRVGEEPPAPPHGGPTAGEEGGAVDLNTADAGRLQELPGIGPVLADRIVAWREEHGPFRHPGDLRQVPGIGERTFQAMADLVVVSAPR